MLVALAPENPILSYIMEPPIDPIAIMKSNMFQPSLKYLVPNAIILIITSKANIAVNTKFTISIAF